MNNTSGNKKKRGHWLVLAIAVPCLYAAAFWNDLQKIDSFCNSIDNGTKLSQLAPLAHKIGVDLRNPFENPKDSGNYLAVAASGFTAGKYKCRIEANSEHVTGKYLGYQ